MTDPVQTEIRNAILTITLRRPGKKNAITLAMYDRITEALTAAERDEAVRAVLLRGEGDIFTAGNDLADFAAIARQGTVPDHAMRFIAALVAMEKPIVAAVQGRAVGIGLTMLLHCDHVVLAEGTLLAAPFVPLALVPEAGSSLLLTARLGHGGAMALFALGETLDASAALSARIAHAIVAVEELDAAARATARRFAALPAEAFRATKRLMRDTETLSSRIEAENGAFAARLQSSETMRVLAAMSAAKTPAN